MSQSQTQAFLSGNLQHVDLHGIEKELLNLWDEAHKETSSETPRVTRACSHSFIAFSTCDKHQENLETMVAEIAIKHPSRAILAYAHEDTSQSLEAWVTARCHMLAGKKGQQICCEQIIVKWSGSGTKNLVSVVAPLTIPDLPTYMWWHEDCLNMDMIKPFLCHIDRFIVDSMYLKGRKNPILQLESLQDAVEEGSAIYDLNWIRTLPWRQSIAHSFDKCRGLLTIEDLDLISQIEIVEESNLNENGDTIPIGTSALFLTGWLATRLNWVFEGVSHEDNGLSISYRLNRTRISVKLKQYNSNNKKEHRGLIREVSIRLRNKSNSTLKIWTDSVSPGLRTSMVTKEDSNNRRVCHKPKTQVELIDTVLNCPTKPKAFEEAVEACCEIVRELS